MLQVSFEYEINGHPILVEASCKSVLNGEDIEDLTLIFSDQDYNRVKIPYDQDLFDDIESTAIDMLAESYYNPELNFERH